MGHDIADKKVSDRFESALVGQTLKGGFCSMDFDLFIYFFNTADNI